MSRKGFTLIEMLVVIAIIAIALPVAFSIFVASLQSQAKVVIIQNVKKNGDFALDKIEYLIKNKIYAIYSDPGLTTEVCTTRSNEGTDPSYPPIPDPLTPTPAPPANTLYFTDKVGNSFYIIQESNRIVYYGSDLNPNPQYLTTSLVKVENLSISCSRRSFLSPPIIAISFSVSQLDSANRHENKATLNYQTKIKLRSY